MSKFLESEACLGLESKYWAKDSEKAHEGAIANNIDQLRGRRPMVGSTGKPHRTLRPPKTGPEIEQAK